MGRKACSVCNHPERAMINRALAIGQAPRSIIRRYAGLGRKAVQKHRDECLQPAGGGG
jgi:hypothetical protein